MRGGGEGWSDGRNEFTPLSKNSIPSTSCARLTPTDQIRIHTHTPTHIYIYMKYDARLCGRLWAVNPGGLFGAEFECVCACVLCHCALWKTCDMRVCVYGSSRTLTLIILGQMRVATVARARALQRWHTHTHALRERTGVKLTVHEIAFCAVRRRRQRRRRCWRQRSKNRPTF